jgi:Protein of unknown function (DUF1186)/SEC-C motif
VIRGEAAVDVQEILEQLTNDNGLPVEAIRAADADRAAVLPAFLQAVDDYVSADQAGRTRPWPIFFIFHLVGSWREKSGYRSLAKLLSLPGADLDYVLGGAITETTHRVMAAVFDGDPRPLYDVILNENADEFVRSRMLETLAMLALRGELTREEVARFLHVCFPKFRDEPGSFVWNGWQSAVAFLRLEEMKPLVEQAFDAQWIDPSWLEYRHFLEDFRIAVEQPDAPFANPDEYALFGDTIEELSTWYCFSERYLEAKKRHAERGTERRTPMWGSDQGQAINPFKNVGRNDPCPCGSGKKFKKCCLDAQRDAPFQGEAA